jgi:hypothetical protein
MKLLDTFEVRRHGDLLILEILRRDRETSTPRDAPTG